MDLDFVKKIDKNWKKHVKLLLVEPFEWNNITDGRMFVNVSWKDNCRGNLEYHQYG